MIKNKIWLGIILSIILLLFSINGFTAYYKYTQESGTNFYVGIADKADALEDTNEMRQIIDDLGALLAHSKRDDLYPKNGLFGGTIQIPEAGLKFGNDPVNGDIAAYIAGEMTWQTKAELDLDLSLYYLKTEIDTLGKVEAIYVKDIIDSDELAALKFTDLDDTPANYTDQAGKYVKVNAGETALEFGTPAGGAVTYLELTDTPATYDNGKYAKSTADGVVWDDPAGAGDMTKAVYDTDTDNIVDKSETVDDGVGNSSTAADIKDAVTKKHIQGTDYSNIVICADYDHPDDAITAIGADNKTLLVTEAETCDLNFTVPANVKVKFERGGKWTINNGITVTFNGQIDAGLYQIFAYTGTGTLAGSPKAKEFYPQWWGALGDNSNDDTTAIQNAIDLVFSKSGGTVYFSEGTYKITSTLTVKNAGALNLKVYLRGEGEESSRINNTNTGGLDAIQFGNVGLAQDNQFWGISDLSVLGNTDSGHGIKVCAAHFGTIERINLSENGKSGIYFDVSWSNWVESVHCWDNDEYGLVVGAQGNNISISNSQFHHNDIGGINVETGSSVRIIGCGIENNGTWGILVDGTVNNTANLFVSGNYFENNPTTAATGAHIKLGGTKIAVNPVIIGNFFYETASGRTVYGIWLENTYTPTIINNQFDGGGFDEKIRTGTATNVIRINNRPDDEGKIIVPQVAFPAAQSASTDANTLDDYEEGTWTMGVSFGEAAVGVTYDINTGYYTKIGNLVTVTGHMKLTSKGESVGNARITGLPFIVVNNEAGQAAVSLRFLNITFANQYQGYAYPNTSTIILGETTEAGVRTLLTDADFAANSEIAVGATYRVK